MTKKIFFAYESDHQENIDAITKGIDIYNSHQKTYTAKSWQELLIGGIIINKEVMREIDECEIFACDLTYLNHNVLFELGYAIGKNKTILPLLNPTISSSKSNYHSFSILKGNGYFEFQNSKDNQSALQKRYIN